MKKMIRQMSLIMISLFVITSYSFANDKPLKQFQYSVTVTGASAEIVSINNVGRDIFIQNNDTTGILYLNLSGVATVSATMIVLNPGESITIPNTINSIAAIGSIPSNANVAISEGK